MRIAATCWKISRRDGVVLGFTDHVRDLEVGGVTYKAASGYTRTTIPGTAISRVDNFPPTALPSRICGYRGRHADRQVRLRLGARSSLTTRTSARAFSAAGQRGFAISDQAWRQADRRTRCRRPRASLGGVLGPVVERADDEDRLGVRRPNTGTQPVLTRIGATYSYLREAPTMTMFLQVERLKECPQTAPELLVP
jgi:hypothetical protein